MEFEIHDADFALNLLQPWWEWDERCSFVAALVDEKRTPVACTRIFERHLVLSNNSFSLRVAGLGGVFTDPSYRNRGHAVTLLRSLFFTLIQKDYAGAILFSRSRSLYRRVGFHPIIHYPNVVDGHQFLWAKELFPGQLSYSESWLVSPPGHF